MIQSNISVYTSAFNAVKHKFDFKFYLEKVKNLSNDIVICVNKSEDNTAEEIQKVATEIGVDIRIVEADIPYNDPLLDGKLKNIALQKTRCQVKLQLDLDEYIPTCIINKLDELIQRFIFTDPQVRAIMLPVVDLYADWLHCRAINQKWYLHKDGLFRGPVNFGKLSNGRVDINKSDTCELIDALGNLVNSAYIIDPSLSLIDKLSELKTGTIPYVVHTGYLNLENRVLRNQLFWQQHWKTESGRSDVFTPTSLSDLNKQNIGSVVLHRLNLL